MHQLVANLLLHLYPTQPGASCTWTLEDVVLELCIRVGLDPRNVNVKPLRGWYVRGFTIIPTYPCTEALRALSNVYLFDVSNYDGRVTFQPRGMDAVALITEADMLGDGSDIEQQRRADSLSVPRVMHLNYHDVLGGLATDKQSSERPGDRRAVGETSIQTPVLMHAGEAAKVVAVNHKLLSEDQRGELKLSLADSFLHLAPADVVHVQWAGKTERARITRIDIQEGYQDYTLMRDRQSAYRSTAEGIPAAPQDRPPSSAIGPTLIEPLDLPLLQDADDALGLSFYVAVSGVMPAWHGCDVEMSHDGGATYSDVGIVRFSAVMGELTSSLSDHPGMIPDANSSCTVTLLTPYAELEDSNFAGMLNRANRALIGEEIVNFADADEVSEGEWELTGLLRGRLGTLAQEHAIGERFVLLDRGFLSVEPASLTDVGRTITLRATSLGTRVADATVVSFVFTGRSQTERSPAYLSARRDGSTLVVSWQGVGRIGGGALVAHAMRFAGYRVTISDGVAADIVVDTDQQQLTRSVSGLGTPLTVSVAQRNQLTGDGPRVEVIVT